MNLFLELKIYEIILNGGDIFVNVNYVVNIYECVIYVTRVKKMLNFITDGAFLLTFYCSEGINATF